ncbi:hypothetical protein I5Q34_09450 [Streptomyces sp. AV19]|uniref:hypothetical protein n=1 Tax=Streptomyces sp. AV19 TaxID=2793068 RepID=UPI0018FE8251|nr:hypothetical protein [Streptomyces sp. AV19]MBH1934509.1 hypothetical protein [Streptomyces sp. AV19]MDG4533303.1 hypothetical protein [Streptomyces sp. AV19]
MRRRIASVLLGAAALLSVLAGPASAHDGKPDEGLSGLFGGHNGGRNGNGNANGQGNYALFGLQMPIFSVGQGEIGRK